MTLALAAVAPIAQSSWLGVPISILLVLLLLAHPIFFALAFVSIVGSHQSRGMKLVWIVFALCAPFLGPLLWFVVGRNQARDRAI